MQTIRRLLSKPDVVLALLLPLLTVAVYVPVLFHDFVNYDDPVYVVENGNIRGGLTWQGIKWAFTPGYDANWIPLTWISHMVDIQLFGMNPAGHHLVNLLIHATSATALFIALTKATAMPWRSVVVAALFALHPLHVESVAWVAERKDVLSGLFWMLTTCAYVWYSHRPSGKRYLLALLLFTLGLMAKPMLVTLPLVLLLLDYWPLRRFESGPLPSSGSLRSRLFLEKVPFLVLSAGSSCITYLTHTAGGGTHDQYAMLARVARATTYYLTYIGKMLWPHKLAVIYPFSIYPPSTLKVVSAAVVLISITLGVIILRRRSPWFLTGWLWYIVTLLPVIGLVHIGQHSVADRYTYIPLTGLFVAIVWGTASLSGKWPHHKRILGFSAAIILLVAAYLTSKQIGHWQNSLTLFENATRVTQGNWVAHNNIGFVLLEEGRVEEAIHHFRKAIKAKPSFASAHFNLGLALRQQEQMGPALEAFRSAVLFDPKNMKARLSLGFMYVEMGDRSGALAEYQVLKGSGSEYGPVLLQELEKMAP